MATDCLRKLGSFFSGSGSQAIAREAAEQYLGKGIHTITDPEKGGPIELRLYDPIGFKPCPVVKLTPSNVKVQERWNSTITVQGDDGGMHETDAHLSAGAKLSSEKLEAKVGFSAALNDHAGKLNFKACHHIEVAEVYIDHADSKPTQEFMDEFQAAKAPDSITQVFGNAFITKVLVGGVLEMQFTKVTDETQRGGIGFNADVQLASGALPVGSAEAHVLLEIGKERYNVDFRNWGGNMSTAGSKDRNLQSLEKIVAKWQTSVRSQPTPLHCATTSFQQLQWPGVRVSEESQAWKRGIHTCTRTRLDEFSEKWSEADALLASTSADAPERRKDFLDTLPPDMRPFLLGHQKMIKLIEVVEGDREKAMQIDRAKHETGREREQLQRSLSELNEELRVSKDQVEKLRSKAMMTDRLTAENDGLKNLNASLHAAMAEQSKLQEQSRQRESALEEEKASLQAHVKTLEDRCASLTALEEEKASLKARVKTLEDRCASLTAHDGEGMDVIAQAEAMLAEKKEQSCLVPSGHKADGAEEDVQHLLESPTTADDVSGDTVSSDKVVLLVEDCDAHASSELPAPDPRVSEEYGPLLELFGEVASQAGADDGKVARFREKLLGVLAENRRLQDEIAVDSSEDSSEDQDESHSKIEIGALTAASFATATSFNSQATSRPALKRSRTCPAPASGFKFDAEYKLVQAAESWDQSPVGRLGGVAPLAGAAAAGANEASPSQAEADELKHWRLAGRQVQEAVLEYRRAREEPSTTDADDQTDNEPATNEADEEQQDLRPVEVTVKVRPPLPAMDKLSPDCPQLKRSVPDNIAEGLDELWVPQIPDGQDDKGRRVLPHQEHWKFHHVFDSAGHEDKLFRCSFQPVLKAVLKSRNACFMAYGQTGSGKTHTMLGDDASCKGMIPRAMDYLSTQLAGKDACVRMAILELYAEKDPKTNKMRYARDLIAPSGHVEIFKAQGEANRAAESSARICNVSGLAVKELPPCGRAEFTQTAMQLIATACGRRMQRGHKLNSASSRGHMVVMLEISQGENSGLIYFLDLAGSEKSKAAGTSGAALDEGREINKSLSALRRVVGALAKQSRSKTGVIPWREHPLTVLLNPFVGGNAYMRLLCTLRPDLNNVRETLGTLGFARDAMAMPNVPKKNVGLTLTAALAQLKVKDQTISELEEKLRAYERQPGMSAVAKMEQACSSFADLLGEAEEQQHSDQDISP